MSKNVFGIDLGTTYSAIAYFDQYDQPQVLINKEQTAVTPSVMYFESATNVLVGAPARESGRVDPGNYVELVKRDMGNPDFVRTLHGQDYRPEQLSAYILKKLMEDAQEKLGEPVTDAVITVPAYFNEAQRTATERAGQIAGLTVRGIIPEPTAAAIAYAALETGDQTLLVYDLGGGTFDVTVMQVSAGRVRTVCIDGDHNLGGRNWDESIVAHLAAKWQEAHGTADVPLEDKETEQELFKQAEEAKRTLSRQPKTVVKVAHAAKSTRVELTRDEFDALTADKLARTVTLTKQVLAEAAKLGVPKVDRLLLVGGSSHMPQVKDRLKAEFPAIEQQQFEPDQAVAKGAAIYAAKKQVQDAYDDALKKFFGADAYQKLADANDGKVDVTTLAPDVQAQVTKEVKLRLPGMSDQSLAAGLSLTVTNACSKSFGVKVMAEGNRFEVAYLIVRNTAVPATREQEFYTHSDGQTTVDLDVFESEGATPPTDPDHPGCRRIKSFTFHLGAGVPVNHPIRVRYSLSDDGGRLRVQATDPATGRSYDETVDSYDPLMPQELDAMRSAVASTAINA